jgi:hypothetical protein
LRRVILQKFTDISDVRVVSTIMMMIIILMMEAASTSETVVNFYQTTWSNNPEDSHLLFTEFREM